MNGWLLRHQISQEANNIGVFSTAKTLASALISAATPSAVETPNPLPVPVPQVANADFLSSTSALTRAVFTPHHDDTLIDDLKSGKARLADQSAANKNSPEVVLAALHADWKQIESASGDLRGSSKFMTQAVGINGNALKGASPDLQDNKDLVTLAVQKNEEAFQYASPTLKRDSKFVFDLCVEKEKSGGVRFRSAPFQFSDVRLRTDKDFVVSLLKEDAPIYRHAPDWLRENVDVASIALSKNGMALKFAPDTVKDNSALVTIALRKEPGALAFASPRLREDRSLNFLAATTGDERILEKVVHEKYRGDETFARDVFTRNKLAYVLLPDRLKSNQEYALDYVKVSSIGFPKLPKSLQTDVPFLAKAVQKVPSFYSTLSEDMQKDHRIILAGASGNPGFLRNVPRSVITDPAFQEKLALTSLHSKQYLLKAAGEISRTAELNYEKLEKAYGVLKIYTGTYKTKHGGQQPRFDNSRAIIEGRYQVASPEVRAQLESVLGKEYFAGVPPVHLDKRPLSVVLMATTDAEGSLAQGGPGDGANDNIDFLTQEHRVVYFQVSTKEELKAGGLEATGEGKYRAKVAMVVGHGVPGAMMLSTEGWLSVEDLEFVRPMFMRLMGDDSLLIWGSCSFGADTVEGQNFVKSAHLMCPGATMCAMTKPGNFHLDVTRPGDVGVPTFFHEGRTLKGEDLLIIRGLRSATVVPGNDSPDSEVIRRLLSTLKGEGAYFAQGTVLDYSAETNGVVEIKGIHAYVDGSLVTKSGTAPSAVKAMVDSCLAKRFTTILEIKDNREMIAKWDDRTADQEKKLTSALKQVLGYEKDLKVTYQAGKNKGAYSLILETKGGEQLVRFDHLGDRQRISLDYGNLAKGFSATQK